MIINNPLFDLEFLNELFLKNEREIYARITSLNLNEEPIEYIEGRITDGTINIDGNSTVRRTCNLTMTAQEININEFYWGIKNKFKLEIGLKNIINANYPDIIWFKQGIFVITEFNTSQSTNKWDIKIQGKDKMCLLNGDLAGHFMVNTNLGEHEDADTKEITDLHLKEILYSIVCVHGKEKIQNVIINDLDSVGQQVQEYNHTEPAYLYRNVKSNEFQNLLLDSDIKCFYQIQPLYSSDRYNSIPGKYSFLRECFQWSPEEKAYEFNKEAALQLREQQEYQDYFYYEGDKDILWFVGVISDDFNINYDKMVSGLNEVEPPTIIRFNLNQPDNPFSQNEYYLARMQAGDLIGYQLTDLTYAGDFIMSVGETLTAALDKIKNMLPNFEYYYDIDGRFVFQQIKDKITTPWNSVETDKGIKYSDALINSNQYSFSFVDSKLISSFSNNPKLTEIKNDYVVWGSYNLSGTAIPLHMRYAIDIKPLSYKPIRPLKEEVITILQSPTGEILNNNTDYKYYDAPEVEPYNEDKLIKIIEKDVTLYGQGMSEFTVFTPEGNKLTTIIYPYFASEPYTSDNIDWRELIYQMALDSRKLKTNDNFLYYIAESNPEYPTGYTGYEQYYTDLELNWRQIYDPNPTQFYNEVTKLDEIYDTNNLYINNYFRELTYEDFDTVTYENLYILGQAESYTGEKSSFTKLYPFAGSEVGNLEIGANYFLTKDGKWTEVSVEEDLVSPTTTELYEDYKTLSETSFRNIYVKNIRPFIVKNSENTSEYDQYRVAEIFGVQSLQDFYVPYYDRTSSLNTYQDEENKDYLLAIQKQFDNIINYLKDLNSLLGILETLQPYGFITSDTYHLLLNTISNSKQDNKTEIINNIKENYFNAYTGTECQQFLNNISNNDWVESFINTINDEVLKAEVAYAIAENLLIPSFIIEEDKYYYQFNTINSDKDEILELIHTLYSQYYIRDPGYIRYDELSDKIKDQYSLSELDSYYFAGRSFSYDLNQLVISEQASKKSDYLTNLINLIITYVSKIKLIHNNEINQTIWDELDLLIEQYGNMILNYFQSWITGFIYNTGDAQVPVEYSCLTSLNSTLQQTVTQMLTEYVEKRPNITFDYMMTIYRNITSLYAATIKSIEANYNQNKEILSILNEIDKLSDEDKEIDNVIKIFQEKLEALKNIVTPLDQTVRSMDALNDYIDYLNDIKNSGDEFINVPFVISTVRDNFERQLYRYIMSLKWYVSIKNEDDIEADEEYNYNANHTLMDLRDLFNNFTALVSSIQNLNQLNNFVNDITIDNVLNTIIFLKPSSLQRIILTQSLYDQIYSTQDITEQLNYVKAYLSKSVKFSSSLVREDTNHFNHYTQTLDEDGNIIESMKLIEDPVTYYYGYYNYKTDKTNNNFWSKDLEENPHLLTFWFDFLNPEDSEIAKYSVPAIGTRTKAVKMDNNIPAIHYQDIPDVIFQKAKDAEKYERQDTYLYILYNEAAQSLFKNYPKGKSAKEYIDDLLYQHSYCTQTVTIQNIPVYHLQPNNRIYIRDDRSSINGEYIVNKLTIPLNFKKMMSINATKVLPNIK